MLDVQASSWLGVLSAALVALVVFVGVGRARSTVGVAIAALAVR